MTPRLTPRRLAACALTAALICGVGVALRQSIGRPPAAVSATPRVELPLAKTALRPTLDHPVCELDPTKRNEMLRRLAPTADTSASTLLHALHLFGPSVTVPEAGGGPPAPVLDLLLDSDRGDRHFKGSRMLMETRYGARFAIHKQFFLGTNQNGSEAHPGQALAVLAGLGLAADQPVRLPGGRAGTLQLLLDDLVANFVLEGEIFWDVVPLILYLPPERAWRNKHGREFTFDAVARELLGRPLDRSPCAGSHRLSALAILLRADAERPVLSDEVRAEVRGHLQTVAGVLTESQRPQGFWDETWSDHMPGGRPGRTGHPVLGPLIATGHHVEWLLLLPPDLRPPDEVFARAGRWLPGAVLELSADKRALASPAYCPLVHAARSALLVSGRVPPDGRR